MPSDVVTAKVRLSEQRAQLSALAWKLSRPRITEKSKARLLAQVAICKRFVEDAKKALEELEGANDNHNNKNHDKDI